MTFVTLGVERENIFFLINVERCFLRELKRLYHDDIIDLERWNIRLQTRLRGITLSSPPYIKPQLLCLK